MLDSKGGRSYCDGTINQRSSRGGLMRKTRFIAAAALAGSAGLAVVAPAAIAGAGAPKPPVEVTCQSLLGSSTEQLQAGCVGSSSKAHTTTYGVTVPNSTDTGGTIYWTNKDTTTITIAEAPITNTCGTYLGVAASTEVQSNTTVTGGTSKLTLETKTSTVCVYVAGGQILVVGGPSTL